MATKMQLQEKYDKRAERVSSLAEAGQIEAADLHELDYLGRFKVANEHWGICDTSARQALLNDQHHFVRSCARIEASKH
ncbi:hypothetical protein [Pseudomonas sp. EMN2]|uniref:hypothetical protein n=1 Tax=Pseudomonas sp. EMN2 TaxID=2615212 RepID=UPI00129ADC33|nr:hypothetical protein [Pseudomonas sp. EMN2]